MKRVSILLFCITTLSIRAWSDDIDPVGFCPPGPDTATTCFAGLGAGNATIGVGPTSFVMEKNGNNSPSNSPWELILALPDYSGPAPGISAADFGLQSVSNEGDFTPSTHDDLYAFTSTVGDGSMNAANLFGANEAAAFGAMPSYFDVFVYSYTPPFVGGFMPYSFTVGGSALPAGTFLAASGGSNPFSTTITVAGLVDGPGYMPELEADASPVSEPASGALLCALSLFALKYYRWRRTGHEKRIAAELHRKGRGRSRRANRILALACPNRRGAAEHRLHPLA